MHSLSSLVSPNFVADKLSVKSEYGLITKSDQSELNDASSEKGGGKSPPFSSSEKAVHAGGLSGRFLPSDEKGCLSGVFRFLFLAILFRISSAL